MDYKIVNKQKCIDDLTVNRYKNLLETLNEIDFDVTKHIEVRIMYTDIRVSLTLLSFGEDEVEYIYNTIIK